MIRPKKTFVLSDESVNSYGFRVLTSGIDLRDFMNNPVMLRNHEGEAIGFWENIRVKDGKLLAEPAFSESDPLAVQTAGKVADGTLKAASIGIEDAVFTMDAKYKLEGQDLGTVTTCKLFEASIVEFPSNNNALVLYHNRKPITLSRASLEDYEVNHLFTNRNQIKMTKETLQLLSLNDDATATDVHNAIVTLLNKLQSNENSLNQYRDARDTEVLNNALALGKITFGQVEDFRLLLAKDFHTTKKLLDNTPVSDKVKLKKDVSISSLIQTRQKQNQQSDNVKDGKAPADKSKWTLSDYRKFDPESLRKNPDLVKSLLKQKQ